MENNMKVKELIKQLQDSDINPEAEIVLKSGKSGDALYFDLWFDTFFFYVYKYINFIFSIL